MKNQQIAKLRKKVELCDREIIRQLARRMELARDIAREKKKSGLAIEDPGRERELIGLVADWSGQRHLRRGFIRVLYKEIFSESKRAQKEI